MDTKALRILIQYRLQTGRLPYERPARLFGSPAAGETCAACATRVAEGQLLMQGRSATGAAIDFHVACFELWNEERSLPRAGTAKG